jgi:hypothetical protein
LLLEGFLKMRVVPTWLVLFLSIALLAPPAWCADDPIAAGDAHLANKQYQEALEQYQIRLRADARDVAALHGAGLAYAALRKPTQAMQHLEKAYAITPQDRAVVANLALVLFANDSQPRACKIVSDYLSLSQQTPDEPLLHSLYFILENASETTRKSRLYDSAAALALSYTRSIEQQRPNYRKWGVGWVSQEVYDTRIAKQKKAKVDLDELEGMIKRSDRDIADAEQQGREIESRVRRGFEPTSRLLLQQNVVSRLQTTRELLIKRRDELRRSNDTPYRVPEPTFIARGTPAPPLPELTEMIAAADPGPPEVETPPAPVVPAPRVPPQRPPVDTTPPVVAPPVAPPVTPPAPPVARRVTRYGVGFAISQNTLVVSYDIVHGASEITVQSVQGTSDHGKVVQSDKASGLAIVQFTKLKAAPLAIANDFAGGPVECVALAGIELFKPDARLLAGTAPKPVDNWTIKLSKSPGLPGAPILSNGKVVGVTLSDRNTEADTVPTVTLAQLAKLVAADTGTRAAFTTDPKAAIFQVTATHDSR